MKIIVTIEMDDYGNVVNQKVEKAIETKSKGDYSDYARYFNEECIGWTKDPEANMTYLKAQQDYANEMLRIRKFIFLNDIYAMLGMTKTKVGQIVGWVYDEEKPIGDNYIDFGIYDYRNVDFVNGQDNKVLLDFNVDGNILNYMG